MKKEGCTQSPIGKLLVVSPFIGNTYLRRTVLITAEQTEGIVTSFIINRKTRLTVNDIYDETTAGDFPIYYGGPCDTDTINILHKYPQLDGAKRIAHDVYYGGNISQALVLIDIGQIKPTEIRFFAGHTWWEYVEIERQANVRKGLFFPKVSDVGRYIFCDDPTNIWSTALATVDSACSILGEIPTQEVLLN